MATWKRLTSWTFGKPIDVNTDNVAFMLHEGERTTLTFIGGATLDVKETPEDIHALKNVSELSAWQKSGEEPPED
jgi:hypothetical protein